jgi:D-3-phosphoglycerate dehydrogenase
MRVLVCDPVHERGLELLRSEGHEVIYRPGIGGPELLNEVGGVHVLLVRGRTRVDRELLGRASKLVVVGRVGVGLDNIDVEFASRLGIKVVNAPEALTNAVAEHTFALLLAVVRSIYQACLTMKRGEWSKYEFMGWELRGKTMGVVGCGRIGMRVAELAKAFGMKVYGYDVIQAGKPISFIDDLEELLGMSDVVTLHLPLTSETRHIIGGRQLGAMKRSGVLINTARGALIDQAELIRALREGRIAGAGLDVFEGDAPPQELVDLPNVVCTPHIAAQTVEAQEEASVLVARRVLEVLSKTS